MNSNETASSQVLAIVVPCYNEAEVLPLTVPGFISKLNALVETNTVSDKSFILLVDDGSSDGTWLVIKSFAETDSRVRGLKLSRNFGHQRALLAGYTEVSDECDAVVSIDCDGQDDIDAIDAMLEHYLNGCDVVYGVRSDRETDKVLKRITAEAFYKLLGRMGVESVFNHADYRLLSARALEALLSFGEQNLFLRGMVPLVGFESETVPYARSKRVAGESHYPFGKMAGLAINGITSLSIKPIRIISAAGIVFSIVSVCIAIWAIVMFATGQTVPGWTSLLCVVLLLGGLQLLALGIIGEYVGRTYLESKNRPRFIVEERIAHHATDAMPSKQRS